MKEPTNKALHDEIKHLLYILAGLLVLLVGFGALALDYLFSPSRDVVATDQSPTGKLVALVEETNGGATTSLGYDIYLQQASPSVFPRNKILIASIYGAIRNENAYGVDTNWVSTDTLQIQYWSAKHQFVPHATVQLGDQSVHVQLCSGIKNDAAPQGGMLLNLPNIHRQQVFSEILKTL
jgi:hypothetical protein